MDDKTARELARLTRDFYEQIATSFSDTRSAPWSGWRGVLSATGITPGRYSELRVLDLACGNLRFERFLADELACDPAPCRIEAFAIDGCDELVGYGSSICGDDAPRGLSVHYARLDVAEALFSPSGLSGSLGVRVCDLAVCFGFMHHVALQQHRSLMLEALVDSVKPGGFVAVSFWQLSHSEKLLAKARATTEAALPMLGSVDASMLGPGDYLLGWQDRTDVLRFCHDFSEAEVSELAASVASKAIEVTRFSADGATGDLNRYLVLQRRR